MRSTCCEDGLAVAPLDGLLCCDLCLGCWVGQWEDERPVHILAHLLYVLLLTYQEFDEKQEVSGEYWDEVDDVASHLAMM